MSKQFVTVLGLNLKSGRTFLMFRSWKRARKYYQNLLDMKIISFFSLIGLQKGGKFQIRENKFIFMP